ncbi:hypothetical protein AVEN_243628-1 [Araneus ventricosus]|uniref:Uncharacterized protein n=1 Tax=Araneus ventricosus TaxID=182803 RepID=A0A4Y2A4W5_ARAVE|nr:hypothetical protein AVEN_243628-1 [Araneus ventricosus]
MMRTTPEVASPLQTSRHTSTPSIPVDSKPYGPNARRILGGIGFRAWRPSRPDAGTLPLGHHCPDFLDKLSY